MSDQSRVDNLTNPVGQLIDRSVEPNSVLGVVTLITPGHVLTSAHLVFKYRRYLEALAVGFPASWQVFGVSAIELHPDFFKIDRYFVTGSSHKPNARAAIESIVLLADRLGAQVIAEGIETEDDLNTVRELGIRMAQGYYLAPPASIVK